MSEVELENIIRAEIDFVTMHIRKSIQNILVNTLNSHLSSKDLDDYKNDCIYIKRDDCEFY